MAIKGFVQLSGIPHSEYYLLNILSEKVLTSLSNLRNLLYIIFLHVVKRFFRGIS
jgi:hypothetical protein